MHVEQGAGVHPDDPLVGVEQHVEGEVDLADGSHNGADVVVHRVPLDHAPPRLRVPDPRRVVQGQDGLEPGQSRRHQLGSAAEAGEEVRLDKAGRDAEVGLDPEPVQPHRHAVPVRAEPGQGGWITGVVVHHGEPGRHAAEHPVDLLRAVAAMGARGHQHHDVLDTDDALELVQDRRDDDVPRLRPGAVAHRDRDRGARAHQLPQRCAVPRCAQCGAHGCTRVGQCLGARRRDHVGAAGREPHREVTPAVRKVNLHDSSRTRPLPCRTRRPPGRPP
jgi:hypothetical protein